MNQRPSGRSLVWVFPEPEPVPVGLAWNGRPELCLGRDPNCDVCITGKQVSRRHAVLTRSPSGGLRIQDLESRNGTRVNGRSISSTELSPGDVVRLGSWVGVVTHAPGRFEELGPGLFGRATLQAALAPLKLAAKSKLPVILEGEAGTGKETVARSLHAWSGRDGAFVSVSCRTLAEGRGNSALCESDLFDLVASAFERADGGTLLLEHVSHLPVSLQAKLLDILAHPERQPFDVRLVVAEEESQRPAVRGGRFDAQLLANRDRHAARLPPLRQRREDVPGIFLDLLRSLAGREIEVDSDLIEKLCLHDWPFNVRELVTLTRHLLTDHGSEALLSEKHLPDRFSPIGWDRSS